MTKVNRREFLKTAALSAVLSGNVHPSPSPPDVTTQATVSIPFRTIGTHKISRLIIGGNPFSYNAHAEPLVYSRELFRHYFTHDKVVETLILAKKNGINTFLGRIDNNVVSFLKLYRKTTGESFPWLAQTARKPMRGATKSDIRENIKFAADNGVTGIYVHGESADYLVKKGQMDDIEEYVAYIRELGLLAGIGGHEIGTIEACEKKGLKPDFYMKTFNSLEYCSPNFERTKEVMGSIEIPWIAFKVLAAGRIKPQKGFAEAVEAGADFLCVGMFDFQVEEDVKIANSLFGEV